MLIKGWTNDMNIPRPAGSPSKGRAVKFYLVMPHPSPLLKEKELPSEPLRDLA
jgi:hypothetical protein